MNVPNSPNQSLLATPLKFYYIRIIKAVLSGERIIDSDIETHKNNNNNRNEK